MRNRATTPLARVKFRQSFSKYNLYNLSRMQSPMFRIENAFQQKWKSKSLVRQYHGEQVTEGQWEKMFSPRLRSVIPMNPEYLASNDGSAESAGRGSGLVSDRDRSRENKAAIKYMQMTFAPLERRLDTAIWRSLFASSTRQARQFVIHGAVKVNGKPMRYPGYLLNPGDMFQVEPERVMYALGAPKGATAVKKVAEGEDGEEQSEETKEEEPAVVEAEEEDVDIERDPRDILKDLIKQSKTILASPREELGAKRKQDLRAFSKLVKRMLSKRSDSIMTGSLETQFEELKNTLNIEKQNKRSAKKTLPSDQRSKPSELEAGEEPAASVEAELAEESTTEDTAISKERPTKTPINYITDTEYNELYAALESMQENPIDESKPYATPWMPREFLSAFAFIPRYLEVNHNVCAAVYLRHPVARPGLSEVPTPYSETVNSNAFNWYLRRR